MVAAAEQKDLNLNFEQSIAAVFNKVAYGSSTTKRSIPDNWSLPHFSTIATPILTTYQYRDGGNNEWLRVDEVIPTFNEKIGPKRNKEEDDDGDIVKERRHQHKSHHHNPDLISYEHDLEKDHVLPTSAPNADILKGNTNKHYSNPNRYANDRAKHNLQVYGHGDIDRIRDTGTIRTYPETRRPSSLLETDSGKIASTQSSYNLLRNINPTPPMHRGGGVGIGGDFPSYSPPTRSHFTPPLPPEYGNPFADKPTLKGTNSGTNNYQNRRPIPPPSIMPRQERIPFRPDLPQIGLTSPAHNKTNGGKVGESLETRKMYNNSGDGKKKVLNTPSLNTDKFGEFLPPHTPINESQFEYDQKSMIPSISRILSGSNGRKDPISDVLLRTVTEKTNYHNVVTRYPPTQSQSHETTKKLHENTSKPKFVEDIIDEEITFKGDDVVQSSHIDNQHPTSTVISNPDPEDETTINIENEYQNLPNINRNKNNFQIYSTKTTYFNATNRDNFYTWHVSWNLHVYLTAILYTLLAVYSIYKIIRFDKLTHLFNQGYFIVVHLLLTTICVSRIFYLIYDPYNINLTFPKFISDILLNLPLSLLAIAFATLICYLLKRTLNKTNFKMKPIFVIIFSFLHIFLCITLHLLENFDLLGKNNILSLVCQFIYVLLCLLLGFSYLYLYKIIKQVLSKKSQNFSELSVQNLSYATHITIAVALLFILMSILQIYGIFTNIHERFSNIPPFKWLAWGFQFSIRLIEIAIIALLSWVVSLKLSIREKNIDNNISSGFALFPCANSNSTVDNEIYPAICQTNQNVHNFTLRSGKSLYDDNYPLGNMDGIPNEIIGRPNLGNAVTTNTVGASDSTFERGVNNFERGSKNNFDQRPHPYPDCHHMNNFEHKANNFERSNYERNSGSKIAAPVHNFDRQYTSRGDLSSSQDINCFDNRYLDETSHHEDHYENPDLELESLTRKSKRGYDRYNSHADRGDNSDACSVNSYHSNIQQKRSYITNPDNDQGVYNEPVDHQGGNSSGAEYGFQKYERANFERPSSRSNSSYSSKHLNRSDKRSNSSSSGNSGTFERRSMRKSGTLNDFGNKRGMHAGGMDIHGGASSHAGFRNGIQTLNSAQKVHSYGKSSGQRIVNLNNDELSDSMLVDENGFVRFRNMGTENKKLERSRRSDSKNHNNSEFSSQMNVGSTLFTELDISKRCWTRDQVALLSSRRSFQNLLPHEDDIDITNEEYIQHMFDYFLLVLENVRNSSYGETKHILLVALSDTLDVSEMVIPLPYFDSKENPVALAVPLKTSPVRNVESKNGVMLLAKYYNIAIQCLESKGNESLMALRAFKESFKKFLEKEVLPKLYDEKFYSVFGGVFRIFKDLKVPFTTKQGSGVRIDPKQVSDDLKKLIPNKYGFILIVIGLAALIWFCIGLVYCLICMRSLKKEKKLKKNVYTKDIRSDNDPYGPKSRDGNSSEKSAKSYICIKKSINQIRRIFSSPTTDKEGNKNKTKFSTKTHKKGCIQNFNQNSENLMASKSSIDTKEKCKPIFNESDSCSSSTTSSKCTQSTKSANSREILDTYVCQKHTNDLKSVSFSPSSPEPRYYPENVGSTTASKERIARACLNTTNYGTCNRAISEESTTLTAYPTKNKACVELSKSKSKHPFKYNFKYDLENTSSSESSPGDQLWPYPVSNLSNTSRIQEKRKCSITKRNN
ncbi:uncharacterized protein LOC123294872 [Chrysoperla carnea]|uniref:uncharacterized protein LOC123294872 n=1 Tax=Chrysoperla carnea TaxID=189513 RepID=UPI001D06884B|nr:uncharacterized protein LOC123294872 [Chrysoperla carnea]